MSLPDPFIQPTREPEYFTCAACGKEFQSAANAANHECQWRKEATR